MFFIEQQLMDARQQAWPIPKAEIVALPFSIVRNPYRAQVKLLSSSLRFS